MTATEADFDPLPPGTTVVPAPDLRTKSQGRILIGGAPLTITRLSAGGGKLVADWFSGAVVQDRPQHQQLARRLQRSGMAHLRLAATAQAAPRSVVVIIPVKDDQQGLTRTLDHLLGDPTNPGPLTDHIQVIVVDDGSEQPASVGPHAAGPHRVSLIRRETAGGPGPARQFGLETLGAGPDIVAFVDAGVLCGADDLLELTSAFDDPAVCAVAPRIRSAAADHVVGRFDQLRSPLDLGPSESIVGPGRQVPYVPTACLVARVEAVQRIGGFDPALRYGEDVDLVWRLAQVGFIRYQPGVVVTHPPRGSVRAMIAQRRSYGSAAAPLAARHGDAVAPTRVSPWSLLVFVLAASGRPLTTAAAAAGTAVALRPKIEPLPDLTVEAFLLTFRGHWYGGLSILTATTRAWAPIAAAAAVALPSQRRRIASVAAAAFCRRLLDGPRAAKPAMVDLGLGVVDDLAYCAGVWQGALKARSGKALYPSTTSWPKRP